MTHGLHKEYTFPAEHISREERDILRVLEEEARANIQCVPGLPHFPSLEVERSSVRFEGNNRAAESLR